MSGVRVGSKVRFERRAPAAPRQRAGFRERCVGVVDWMDATHALVRITSCYAFHPENEEAGRMLPERQLECIELTEVL
jgi:hypothetical protein